uniref:Uncharacterized protein n=1 Tax=Anguilla anguilla TaxID=7936 RepID=A0A0E9VZ19_ANGAN
MDLLLLNSMHKYQRRMFLPLKVRVKWS